MNSVFFLDVAPDPVGLGIVAVVVLLVIGSVILLAAGLVFFLWFHKRRMRTAEMIRDEASPVVPAVVQPSIPNQP